MIDYDLTSDAPTSPENEEASDLHYIPFTVFLCVER